MENYFKTVIVSVTFHLDTANGSSRITFSLSCLRLQTHVCGNAFAWKAFCLELDHIPIDIELQPKQNEKHD